MISWSYHFSSILFQVGSFWKAWLRVKHVKLSWMEPPSYENVWLPSPLVSNKCIIIHKTYQVAIFTTHDWYAGLRSSIYTLLAQPLPASPPTFTFLYPCSGLSPPLYSPCIYLLSFQICEMRKLSGFLIPDCKLEASINKNSKDF